MDDNKYSIFDVLPWVILFLPLASAVLITLFARKERQLSAYLSVGAVTISFVGSIILFILQIFFMEPQGVHELGVNWLSLADPDLGLKLVIGFKFLVDPLSILMTMIVTGVGAAIHWYSYGYMREDKCLPRYFASLSLFTFSMLGIVFASNFVMMFIFWELVGVSSYLLIGFWHEKASAADACKKAFITNRLGDFGFLTGIMLLWWALGSTSFDSLGFTAIQQKLASKPEILGTLSTAAGLLIFCGAMGKSAQFPLHVWLPDAMEGPTPVSALIHAATMVAAGVYMLCRVYFLFDVPGSEALHVISWIGGFTALIAALMAIQQNDIKRILAYSTLSQLGYMVMSVGLHSPASGMYHLTTHAFFKAMLFLGAGSVIHALHHEQDIWRMGGLRRKMPVTFVTFAIGTLALCGLPPFSGFYSKDAILAAAAEQDPFGLFILGVVVAGLTAFYMFRLIFVAFLGASRSDASGHAHESPRIMTIPLVILAVPSVISGWIGLDEFLGDFFRDKGHLIADASLMDRINHHLFGPFNHNLLAALGGLLAAMFGFSLAFGLYRNAMKDPLPQSLGSIARWMRDRFYFDELYEWLIANSQESLAGLANWFDRWIIDGGVKVIHFGVAIFGRALRLLQSGNLQTYAFLLAAGVVFALFFALH